MWSSRMLTPTGLNRKELSELLVLVHGKREGSLHVCLKAACCQDGAGTEGWGSTCTEEALSMVLGCRSITEYSLSRCYLMLLNHAT